LSAEIGDRVGTSGGVDNKSDPSHALATVPQYGTVVEQNLYPGINLVWQGQPNRQLEYNFQVAHRRVVPRDPAVLTPGIGVARVGAKVCPDIMTSHPEIDIALSAQVLVPDIVTCFPVWETRLSAQVKSRRWCCLSPIAKTSGSCIGEEPVPFLS
jgi:hypothetical protein